jgi:hypothetical protein
MKKKVIYVFEEDSARGLDESVKHGGMDRGLIEKLADFLDMSPDSVVISVKDLEEAKLSMADDSRVVFKVEKD